METATINSKTMTDDVLANVDFYIDKLFAAEDYALQAAKESVSETSLPANFNISANQGKFLHFMAKLTNSKKILEIGILAC